MDIGFAVDSKPLVLGENLRPQLSIPLVCPIVFVESAPEDRSAVLVQMLLRNNAVVEALDIHHADSIVGFAVDRNRISTNNIHRFFASETLDGIVDPLQQALGT